MTARRVAKVRRQVGQHLLQHRGIDRRRAVVIQVDTSVGYIVGRQKQVTPDGRAAQHSAMVFPREETSSNQHGGGTTRGGGGQRHIIVVLGHGGEGGGSRGLISERARWNNWSISQYDDNDTTDKGRY